MNGKEIAMKLKEGDTKYQEFFRNALKKFGEKTPADMSVEEKKKFFKYIEDNWTDEDPETNDNDVSTEGCDKKKRKMSKEDIIRQTIRKEIASVLKEK